MGDHLLTKRVFVNDVDHFSSKHIAKFLSTCLAEEDEDEESSSVRGAPAFHVVGTVSSTFQDGKDSGVMEHYLSPTREELLGHLFECDVILYNISENATQNLIEEATWAVTTLNEEMERFKSRKLFILISTVMTWAMTKPQNPDETDVPIHEEEFRKRRPHPSFRAHFNLEKLVLKLSRSKKTRLPSYVVFSGLQYGKGENLFHYFFKFSWLMQSSEVPIFGQGTNCIPMIHVYDLGGVIQGIILTTPPSKAILAVDDSKNTWQEIVLAIGTALGPANVRVFPEEDAISMKAFQPEELNNLKVNLNLEVSMIKQLNLEWISEAGMVENIDNIVEEYKVTRKLHPVRIFIAGPPAAGKTTLAKKLCDFYQLHLIQAEAVVEEKLRKLEELESQGATAAEQAGLKEILESHKKDGAFSLDEKLLQIVAEKLSSKPCLNQGFVLDGFPHTYEQAQALFSDSSQKTEGQIEPNKKITPDNVFVLVATDEFLRERVQALPESAAERSRYTQDAFHSRLKDYRRRCAADDTLQDYFDELEIFPEEIEIKEDDVEYTAALKKITGMVGKPINSGPSPEGLKASRTRLEEESRQRLASETAERKRRNEAILAEMAAHYQQWKKSLSELERQQQELLSARRLPLRTYLMKYVMPSLSEAMLECSKVRPEDPVDFLAEYLLRTNSDIPPED